MEAQDGDYDVLNLQVVGARFSDYEDYRLALPSHGGSKMIKVMDVVPQDFIQEIARKQTRN